MTDPLVESTVLEDRLRSVLPVDVDYASVRLVDERSEHLRVRRNELEPVFNEFDTGVMISIWAGGGLGYAATTDISEAAWSPPSSGPATGPV
jgi:predicted Zn-dependent protease